MHKNNFDQSSTGVDIELCIFLDGDLAREYFEDFVSGADGSYVKLYRDRQGTLDYIAIWADEEDAQNQALDLRDLLNMEYGDLEALHDLHYPNIFYGHPSERAEMEDWLHSNVTAEKLMDSMYEERLSWHDLDCEYVSRGYSQGDAVMVWLSDRAKEEMPHLKVSTYIDHLLWDAPVSGVLTVDGVEYYLDEMLGDVYTYDKDELIQNFRGHHDDMPEEVYQFLEENLPIQPDYVG